jgi:hypothetical protein
METECSLQCSQEPLFDPISWLIQITFLRTFFKGHVNIIFSRTVRFTSCSNFNFIILEGFCNHEQSKDQTTITVSFHHSKLKQTKNVLVKILLI